MFYTHFTTVAACSKGPYTHCIYCYRHSIPLHYTDTGHCCPFGINKCRKPGQKSQLPYNTVFELIEEARGGRSKYCDIHMIAVVMSIV